MAVTLAIPYGRTDIVADCYKYGRVLETTYEADHIVVRAEVTRDLAGRLSTYAATA